MSTHTMHTVLNRTVPVPEEAALRYLEEITVYKVHNRWLRAALAGLVLVMVMMAAAGWKLSQSYADRKPIVVRVNPSGDAVIAPYASLEYQPREPEVRHFLMKFVQDHYSRVRATARDAFQRKLFFLASPLARATMEEEGRTK